jgi:hypothetical protein
VTGCYLEHHFATLSCGGPLSGYITRTVCYLSLAIHVLVGHSGKSFLRGIEHREDHREVLALKAIHCHGDGSVVERNHLEAHAGLVNAGRASQAILDLKVLYKLVFHCNFSCKSGSVLRRIFISPSIRWSQKNTKKIMTLHDSEDEQK